MADNLNDRGPADRTRIHLSERSEVDYWTKELGVSEQALRALVQTTGSSVDAVRKQLGK